MRCLEESCRAPLACSGWGYCRIRNMRPLTHEEEAADALGSYNEAVRTCGERYKAGEPIPEFFQLLRKDAP